MVAPLCTAGYFIHDAITNSDPSTEAGEKRFYIIFGLAALDTLLSITALTLAILGTVQTIAMPAAAFGSLYGVSGLITVLWIPLAIMGTLLACSENHSSAR